MNALPDTSSLLGSALELCPFGAAYYREGRFLWVNPALCELVGYSREALLRMDPFNLLEPAEEERARERARARQRGESPTTVFEILVRRGDGGGQVTLEAETLAVAPGDVLVFYRDLSVPRRAQSLLEGLAQLAARVQRARTPESVIAAALDGLFGLGFQAAIAETGPAGYTCSWRFSLAIETMLRPLFVRHVDFGRFAPLDDSMRTLEPVYLEDALVALRPSFALDNISLPPAQTAELRRLGLDKVAIAPFSVHGRPFGALVVVGEGLSRQTSAALALFAAQLASALEAAETIVELQQKNRRLAAINALADAGNEVAPAGLAERLLQVVIEATASDSASVFRASDQALELESTVNVPDWFAAKFRRLPFATTVTGGAAAKHKARAMTLKDWPPSHHADLERAGGLASALLPLEVKGKLVGLMVLSRARPEGYRDDELATAEVLAAQVAVQLERARLLLELRRSYDELGQTQQELVKQERLAALGELSAVVAHEVRNPLGVVFNSLASLRRMAVPEEARGLLSIVSEESERLDRLVSDLLDFARPHEPRLVPEPPALLVATVVEDVRRGSGLQGVELSVEVPDGLPSVRIDLQLCRQALLNLVLNAAQAAGRNGKVTIRARFDADRKPPAVRLDVSDSGDGIAPELADRIFQPFFTTRASGTGLGLALVKRIAESHRAEIGFESAPGVGTTFSLWLPVASPTR